MLEQGLLVIAEAGMDLCDRSKNAFLIIKPTTYMLTDKAIGRITTRYHKEYQI